MRAEPLMRFAGWEERCGCGVSPSNRDHFTVEQIANFKNLATSSAWPIRIADKGTPSECKGACRKLFLLWRRPPVSINRSDKKGRSPLFYGVAPNSKSNG